MGAFDRLKEDLNQQRERGCEPSDNAKKFVEDYDRRVKDETRSLKDRQERDR